MLKLLLFSDLHISNRNPKFKYTNGISDLLLRQQQFVDYVVEYSKNNSIDCILFLGDWTDYPNLDPITLFYSNNMLSSLIKSEIDVFLLEGNHCLSFKDNSYSVLDASSQLVEDSDIKFINNFEKFNFNGLGFYFVPYHSDYELVVEQINKFNDMAANDEGESFLFFHLPTVNALLDNGIKSSNGIELTADMTSNFKKVFGGDFHRTQKLINNKKAMYVGAPFDLNFGDYQKDRGFIIYDTDKDKIIHEKNPFKVDIQKIDLETLKNLSEEQLREGIYKIIGDFDIDEQNQISEIRNKAYKVDVSLSREKSVEKPENAEFLEVFDKSNDESVLRKYLKDNKFTTETTTRLVSLFKNVEKDLWKS